MRTMTRNVLNNYHVQVLQQYYLNGTRFHSEAYNTKYGSAQDEYQIVGDGPSTRQLNIFITHSVCLSKVFFIESPIILPQNVYQRRWENNNCQEHAKESQHGRDAFSTGIRTRMLDLKITCYHKLKTTLQNYRKDSTPNELFFVLASIIHQFDPKVILFLPGFEVLILHALGLISSNLF